MCTGYSIQMVCGHTLMHFATRCLTKCAAPDGPVGFIHDTCAQCHPDFVIKNLRERYYTERERIMARYRHAVSYNLGDEAKRLTKVLGDLEDTCRKDIAAAKFFGEGLQPDEVIFPGKLEQDPRNTLNDVERHFQIGELQESMPKLKTASEEV
ncbi:hypothetical protein B0T24DRAFT_293124 [Lasiosphaeria ovina]|uniref:Uncharacterized protein n=1 Tax=Lasiosphaeria ovina TaxID=92902 RepID=A0AAE0N8Q8_9PEZI|nr:hypothetical protein B0T24DRAFT_293124 [Lasiosphaeria ovina]